MTYGYFNNCVNWDRCDVHNEGGLRDMIDAARDITRRTFLANVGRGEFQLIEHNLGYAHHPKQGLTMSADWHISYHRSKLHGKRVYFFKHSSIEYVFKDQP